MTSTALPPLPFKVKTIVSWAGEEEGDLGFMENEIVQVFPLSMKVGGVEITKKWCRRDISQGLRDNFGGQIKPFHVILVIARWENYTNQTNGRPQ